MGDFAFLDEETEAAILGEDFPAEDADDGGARFLTEAEERAALKGEAYDPEWPDGKPDIQIVGRERPRKTPIKLAEPPESLRAGAPLPGIAGSDVGGDTNFVQGIGNALNIQKGLARFLPGVDDRERLLKTIDDDQKKRRSEGIGYGAGELVGNTAVGLAAGPASAGLRGGMAVGALEGGVSELNRTGDVGDAIDGAVGGMVAAVGGEMLGRLGRHGVSKLESAIAEAAAKSGRSVVSADKVQRAAEMIAANPNVDAQAVLQFLVDVGSETASAQHGLTRKIAGVAVKALPKPLTAASRGAGLLGRGAAPWMGEQWAGESGVASAQWLPLEAEEGGATYEETLAQQVSPLEDTRDEHFDAFVEAYDSPVMQAYPGLAGELSGMLQEWSTGNAPADTSVALMAYKLSEVPGLRWAELDPARRGIDDE